MHKVIEQIIKLHTQENEVDKVELIQDLWSGYGQLNRIHCHKQTYIIKLIKFPELSLHPKGHNSEFAHNRKVRSYQTEIFWYQNYTKHYEFARTAQIIAHGNIEKYQYILLEDLKRNDFTPQISLSWHQTKLCLKWLANFHNTYLEQEPIGLWEVGTYWHLATRPDELEKTKDDEVLKLAPLIDEKLNKAKFKTIVHGDAKLSNFLFSKNRVAAVDFQYVGGGAGIKDVAYFLSSIYSEEELFEYESRCLEFYFEQINNKAVELEWRTLYSYAWADFYRFLAGWTPDHYKINNYSEEQFKKVLNDIK